MYGDEVVVPLELEIPSLHVSLDGLIPDADRRKYRLAQLEVLDEKRFNALEHLYIYHYRTQKSYSKKIKPKEFKFDELVVKENISNKKGKFEPNWIGHCIIIANYGKGVYKFSIIKGK